MQVLLRPICCENNGFRVNFATATVVRNTVEAPVTWVVDLWVVHLWVVVLSLVGLMRLLVHQAVDHVGGDPLEGARAEDPVVHSSIFLAV